MNKILIASLLFVSSSVLATELPAQSALDKMKQEYLIEVEKNKIESAKVMLELDNLIQKNKNDLAQLQKQGAISRKQYYNIVIVENNKTIRGKIYVAN